jgi:hypothetical protein
MSGGLVMTIFRRAKPGERAAQPAAIRADDDRVAVADFSYQNDDLAKMIVEAWVNPDFRRRLLQRNEAQALLAERGIHLRHPVVIEERTYNENTHTLQFDDEVVFVLPDPERVDIRQQHSLLETARFLMACVPNGI